jgi:hypothetical protein
MGMRFHAPGLQKNRDNHGIAMLFVPVWVEQASSLAERRRRRRLFYPRNYSYNLFNFFPF